MSVLTQTQEKTKEVYAMLNEAVINVLKNGMWDLATCANGEPNVVPVAFKDVTEDGKLLVGDVFLETTLNNIKANDGKIAISVYDAQNLEGYQIKGTAEYVTEGAVVDTFKAMVEKMFNGAATAKGALIITPAKASSSKAHNASRSFLDSFTVDVTSFQSIVLIALIYS